MPLKIVIDTNVCLDLFAFRDPRWAPLLKALEDRTVIASTGIECREEWLAVLNYPHLPVYEQNRAAIVASFDRFIPVEEYSEKSIRLPTCTDKDDQKFMEHCRDSDSQFLISKDKALLKLGRKTRALGLFSIETPEQFLKHIVANPQALELISPKNE